MKPSDRRYRVVPANGTREAPAGGSSSARAERTLRAAWLPDGGAPQHLYIAKMRTRLRYARTQK